MTVVTRPKRDWRSGGSRAEHDVELAAGRVGIVLSGHPEDSGARTRLLNSALIVWPARRSHRRMVHRQGLGLRVTELHDEPWLDAMEALAVLESARASLRKFSTCFGRVGGKESERECAALLERDDRVGVFGRLVLGQRRRGDQDDHREREQTIHDGTTSTLLKCASAAGPQPATAGPHAKIMMRSSLYMPDAGVIVPP